MKYNTFQNYLSTLNNLLIFILSAENVAVKYSISREEQDKYAAESQQKTENAQKNGYFQQEIIPVTIKNSKGEKVIKDDEYPKHGTSLEILAKLRPVFTKVIFCYKYNFVKSSINIIITVYVDCNFDFP